MTSSLILTRALWVPIAPGYDTMTSTISSFHPASGNKIAYDHLLFSNSILVGSATVNVFLFPTTDVWLGCIRTSAYCWTQSVFVGSDIERNGNTELRRIMSASIPRPARRPTTCSKTCTRVRPARRPILFFQGLTAEISRTVCDSSLTHIPSFHGWVHGKNQSSSGRLQNVVCSWNKADCSSILSRAIFLPGWLVLSKIGTGRSGMSATGVIFMWEVIWDVSVLPYGKHDLYSQE